MNRKFWTLVIFTSLLLSVSAGAELIDRYPDTESMYAEIGAMAARDPARVELIEYGKSVEGRPLMALRFHAGDGEKCPGVMVAANIHGEEWIANRAAMAAAARLERGIEEGDWTGDMLNKMDVYILPCLNPDGYDLTSRTGGKEKLSVMRKNANGVDLNRNFPVPYGQKMKELDNDGVNYAGAAPLSEPETRAVVDFVIERNIIATVDYHSVTGVFGTPTCHNLKCVNRYEKMCLAHARGQKDLPYMWMVLARPGKKEFFPGQMEPYLYHERGVMAILVELGLQPVNVIQNGSTGVFETFNPRNPDFWAENEAEAALRSLAKAYEISGGKEIPEDER